MSLAPIEVHWPLQVQPDATGVELLFAPTRSAIVGAEADVEGVDPARVQVRHDELSVRISWEIPGQARTPGNVTLRLRVAGEHVQQPIAIYYGPDRRPLGRAFTPSDYGGAVYKAREQLALGDKAQAFLFELDRLTLKALLPFCKDLLKSEREFRREMIPEMIGILGLRLKIRHVPGNPPARIPAVANGRWVRYVSDIFRGAAGALGGDLAAVGRTLEEFAAGDHRRDVPTGLGGHRVTVSEPDGYFVFLFAEFALVAIEHGADTQMWMRLLKSLVKMQSYFLARWQQPPTCMTDHRMPLRTLDPTIRVQIDLEYARLGDSLWTLADKMVANLRQSPCH